ncbi:MAG: hypothetical protein COA91_01490 [Robiginitomaculum sp.]|nr:MAG: hypothetical protein COA91_01490 [Robiginitomaculum sp.]
MDDLDKKIHETLSDEDNALMAHLDEQGLLAQLGGLFKGKLAWLSITTIFIGTIMTIIAVFAIWKFVTVDDVPSMLRWAGLAWITGISQMMIKLWSWMRMETNRTLREIKRLELQIARMNAQ